MKGNLGNQNIDGNVIDFRMRKKGFQEQMKRPIEMEPIKKEPMVKQGSRSKAKPKIKNYRKGIAVAAAALLFATAGTAVVVYARQEKQQQMKQQMIEEQVSEGIRTRNIEQEKSEEIVKKELEQVKEEMVKELGRQYNEAYPENAINKENFGYLVSTSPNYLYEVKNNDGSVSYIQDSWNTPEMPENGVERNVIKNADIGISYGEVNMLANKGTNEILAGFIEINGETVPIQVNTFQHSETLEMYYKSEKYLENPQGIEELGNSLKQAKENIKNSEEERDY